MSFELKKTQITSSGASQSSQSSHPPINIYCLTFDWNLNFAQISVDYILIVNRKYFAISFLPHHVAVTHPPPTPLSLPHPTRSCIIAHFNYKSLQVSQIPAEYLTLIALHSAESLFLLCKIIILSNYKTADMGSIFLHKYNRIICRISCWMCFSCER